MTTTNQTGTKMNNNSPEIIKTFEDKIKDRLKEQMGELLPDEVLSKMVSVGVEKVFFEKRRVNVGSQSYPRYEDTRSWFEEELDELLTAKMKALLDSYIKDNEKEISQKMGAFIVTNGASILAHVVLMVISGRAKDFDTLMFNFKDQVENSLRQMQVR